MLEKSGAWYAYNGEKIAQGREKAKLYFEANPAAAAALEKSVRDKFFAQGAKFEEIKVAAAEGEEGRPTVEPIAAEEEELLIK
jgi:recombination protein RecA